MDAQRTEMKTRDGVRVTRTATPFDPAELGRIAALVDQRRGGVMSSGMEYPGRSLLSLSAIRQAAYWRRHH